MFPKKQRIVKKKEIEKALKTPFRTGFDFGQILLFSRKNINKSQEINKISKSYQQNSAKNANLSEENSPTQLVNNLENIQSQKNNKFRVICIVSKKIHKKANQRNKIRRRFLAIFKELDSQNRLPPGLDLAIIIRTKDILTAKFSDFQKIVPSVSQFYQKLRFQNKI